MLMRFKMLVIYPPMMTGDLGEGMRRNVVEVAGVRDVDAREITVHEMSEMVIQTEQFLEKILGVRVHIEQVH
jgi:hypothetical protein